MQKLSAREAEVLRLYLEKGTLQPVAEALGVSINTVRSQRTSFMKKLGVSNQVQLGMVALKKGLVDIEGKD